MVKEIRRMPDNQLPWGTEKQVIATISVRAWRLADQVLFSSDEQHCEELGWPGDWIVEYPLLESDGDTRTVRHIVDNKTFAKFFTITEITP